MRFEVCKSTRRGLECFERLGKLHYENEKAIQTPSCTLYMPSGCVPFVTNDLIFRHVNHLPQIAEVPFSTIAENRESLIAQKKPFKEFMHLKGFLTYMSMHDTSKQRQAGYGEGLKLAIWSKKGKILVSSDMYAEFVNTVKFDLVECMYDHQIALNDSKKQIKKAYERIVKLIDIFYEPEAKLIKNTDVAMPLIGKDNLEIAKQLTEHIAESKYVYKTIVYHGMELNKTSFEVDDLAKFEPTIKAINVNLMRF
jgi:hypothetical protein